MKVFIIILATVVILGGIFVALFFGRSGSDSLTDPNNVAMVDGKQVITIRAKGGYSPRSTTAKANLPTVLKVVTRGTFDCSAALVVPSVGYRSILPQTGTTLIEIPPQKVGSAVQGICSMGMYNFVINFS